MLTGKYQNWKSCAAYPGWVPPWCWGSRSHCPGWGRRGRAGDPEPPSPRSRCTEQTGGCFHAATPSPELNNRGACLCVDICRPAGSSAPLRSHLIGVVPVLVQVIVGAVDGSKGSLHQVWTDVVRLLQVVDQVVVVLTGAHGSAHPDWSQASTFEHRLKVKCVNGKRWL